MTWYFRSDNHAQSAVPGCDQEHRRPLNPETGEPVAIWGLDCPAHEAYLKGDGRPLKLVYETDPKTGQPTHQKRVPDSSPMGSTTRDTIPLTPDEERVNAVRETRGSQQIQMIQALAALRATGINVPDDAAWLLERELPSAVLKGTVLCANHHDNPAGVKFCGECGASMATRAAIGGSDDYEPAEPAVDLSRLHVQSLRKMAREKGLPDKGSKNDLIARLAA